MTMEQDKLEFFKSLLSLHERHIEQKLKSEKVDLDDFLAYTQRQLDRLIQNDFEFKHRGFLYEFLDVSKTIADTKKVQSVIVRMLDEVPTITIKLPQRLIALVYHEKNIPIDSQNMDAIASRHGWTSKNSGKKLKDQYNNLHDAVALKKAQVEFNDEQKQKVVIL